MKDPAFPMYAADFIMGTMCMSFEDIGRYTKLLCYQWDKGRIPKKRLGLLVGIEWVNFGDDLREKFIDSGMEIFNERLENVREKRAKFKEKQSVNGSKGGRPKKESPIDSNLSEYKNPNKSQTKAKQNPNKSLLENENENEIISLISTLELTLEYNDVVKKWLDYKKSRGEKYKSPQSLKSLISHLATLSGKDSTVAAEIVEQSIANNWAGLFELKHSPQKPRAIKTEMPYKQLEGWVP